MEEITLGFKELNQNVDKTSEDMKTVFHILTGVADTFVLVLENISLSKVINDEREEMRKQMLKFISSLNEKQDQENNESRNYSKIGTKLVRTASSNYRIHSKKGQNNLKSRKIFIENTTPLKNNKTEVDNLSTIPEVLYSTCTTSTVIYKGDAFEISSLNSFSNKIIETLEKTNFPWRNLVKKSIKAIESFRKKQPKTFYKTSQRFTGTQDASNKYLEIPLGPTETTALNFETESGGIASSRKGNITFDGAAVLDTYSTHKNSTPLLNKATSHLDKIRPSTDVK